MHLHTDRLTVRPLTVDDAPFVLRLLNEPSWLQYIGDRGVRTLDDARCYLDGQNESIARAGYGLLAVTPRSSTAPIGLCGLLKRDFLADPDIGFAFLPEAWGHGYAHEAAAAVLQDARARLGLRRIVAITSLNNQSSIRLLGKLGFREEDPLPYPTGETVRFFVCEL